MQKQTNLGKIVLVGYSGHAYVVAETLMQMGYEIAGYTEKEMLKSNPFDITYLGFEQNTADLESLKGLVVFPSIGDNAIRKKVLDLLEQKGFRTVAAIHPQASLSSYVEVGTGTLICRGVSINPLVKIGHGVIVNTGAIVEHECKISDFAHIGPGAVLNGNVKVGPGSFVGANAVIKQGVEIGANVVIGAGAVVLEDVEDNFVMVGNPAKRLRR